jgi:phosphoglycolate phosphatase
MPLKNPHPCRLFLFDLDGTLIDSVSDIAFSVNAALTRMGMNNIPEYRIEKFVGDGVQILIERTMREITGKEAEEALIQRGISLFKEEYSDHLLDRTCLRPHIKETLDRLSWADFAVVTNKPELFSRRILDGLGIGNRFSLILGGDSGPARKPDPASLLEAMSRCKATPSETAMVGDSPMDIIAGKAAGTVTCAVLGGFRTKDELIAAGPDLIIEDMLELAVVFCPG